MEETENVRKKVKIVISDLHLGAGWSKTPNDNLEAFHDDEKFKHFIKKYLIKRYKNIGAEVELILNGDTFDSLAVLYHSKSIAIPYERVDLHKIRKIINGHPYVFSALKEFVSCENFKLTFIIGNHDLCLYWKSVQEEIVKRLGEENSSRILFKDKLQENSIYIAHGNTEHHNKTPENPIVDQTFLSVWKRGGWKKLFKDDIFSTEKVLNMPIGHYLVTALENPLKKHNLLIGHMRHHGFIWLDAIFGFGRKTRYRRHRFFAAIAVLTCLLVTLKFWWEMRDRHIFKKIVQVLWWTIAGALDGQRPEDEAKRLLERDDINVVIFGHEHVPRYEIVRVGAKNKLYVNCGTWQLIYEVKVEPIEIKWRRFRSIEGLYKKTKRFFKKMFWPEVEEITEFTAVEIIEKEDGLPNIQLLRFNDDKRELEKLV